MLSVMDTLRVKVMLRVMIESWLRFRVWVEVWLMVMQMLRIRVVLRVLFVLSVSFRVG